MLFVNAALSALFLILFLSSGDPSELTGSDIISPFVSVIVGVNLWQVKEQWKRYTVWWALLGLVIFGASALVAGDYFSLLAQIGFSGSLILLLAGRPSKMRTTVATLVFVVVYLGLLCLGFALAFLGAMAGTGG